MKIKTLFWLLALIFLCGGLYQAFHLVYLSTQELKSTSNDNPFQDVSLNHISAVTRAMEFASSSVAVRGISVLSSQKLWVRQTRLASLSTQNPKAHELYQAKCLVCHGSLGQGGKNLRLMDTRLSHRAEPYKVPPLFAEGMWTSNLESFYHAATKLDRPHLPRTMGISDRSSLRELQKYLKELTR